MNFNSFQGYIQLQDVPLESIFVPCFKPKVFILVMKESFFLIDFTNPLLVNFFMADFFARK